MLLWMFSSYVLMLLVKCCVLYYEQSNRFPDETTGKMHHNAAVSSFSGDC